MSVSARRQYVHLHCRGSGERRSGLDGEIPYQAYSISTCGLVPGKERSGPLTMRCEGLACGLAHRMIVTLAVFRDTLPTMSYPGSVYSTALKQGTTEYY